MTRIAWGLPGSKTYHAGLDRGVLYPFAGGTFVDPGVPWVGLVSISENVSGGEVESFYKDGIKYLDVILHEDFQATLEAYDSPREFAPCDGTREIASGLFATQQPRRPFHMCYRRGVGNDLDAEAGTRLHLLYNLMASPAEKAYRTRTAEAELESRSWTLYGKPPKAGIHGGVTYKPTAQLILDLSALSEEQATSIEDHIYGSDVLVPALPTQQALVTYINTGVWP